MGEIPDLEEAGDPDREFLRAAKYWSAKNVREPLGAPPAVV